MTESDVVRVMLVDDHAVVRSGLGAVLLAYDGLELVGEAGNGEEAVRLCEKLKPDVILMDILMPVMDGTAATKVIHERFPGVRIIILTSFKEKELVEGALKAGAMSYLLKSVSAQELVGAIRGAVTGRPSLSPEAAQVLIQNTTGEAKPFDLTESERGVLALMVEGLPNKEIAEKLSVSYSTVKFHVSNILSKLGAESRTEAVSIALKHRLVK